MTDVAMQDSAPAGDAAKETTLARAHPLAAFGLDALVAGAARQRPRALALAARGDGVAVELSYAELDRAIGAFLAHLRDFDIAPGERALVLGAPGAQTFVALTALVALGVEPVLAPAHLSRDRLTRAAETTRAQAIFAPTRFAGLDLEETLLTVAARTPSVRLLGMLDEGVMDGAADFSLAALRGSETPIARLNDGWTTGERAMVGALDQDGAAHFLSQGALLGAALDLLRAARKGGAAPIVSLISPGSFAGLVAGPLAALLAGAPLHLLAPFDAAGFLDLLDAVGPVRLVAPSAILPDLFRAGLLDGEALRSVAAVSAGAAPAPIDCACPIVEIIVDGAAIEIRTQIETRAQAA